jgi:bifunctional non-homologous end joining protein LigD
MEYGDFEGIIPKGNYGAGEVIIWDEGTFSVPGIEGKDENEHELKKMLHQGNIKLQMAGAKIKGHFALVRTQRKDGKGNEWLLIKKKDDYATEKDILQLDQSVRTGRTIEELKNADESKVELWHSATSLKVDLEGTPETKFPGFVKPTLASLSDKAFNNPDWIFEIKWDGFRCISSVNYNKVQLWSRNNLSFNADFPQIVEELKTLGFQGVFDGEIVVLNEKGISSFQLIQNFKRTGAGRLVYYIFDILYLNGHDLTGLELSRRKEILRSVLPSNHSSLRFSDHIQEYGNQFYDKACQQELEGIIAKKASSRYQQGKRVSDWLKIKILKQQEAVIAGFTEPRGSRKKLGSLLLGVYEDGELNYIGNSGGGFDDKALHEIYNLLKPLEIRKSAFRNPPATNMPVHWVKPQLVCEVRFQEWTTDKIMRQPVFLGLRPDKDPMEIIREVPVRASGKIAAGMRKPYPGNKRSKVEEKEKKKAKVTADKVMVELPDKKEGLITIGNVNLQVTNLNKILWPESGLTKRDLLTYYDKISPFILPYLKDRPQSLRRSPHGLAGGDFFQKNMPANIPVWLHTEKVFSESNQDDINFLICNDPETLLYMANLGCIELNPWNSRLGSLDYPDYTVIDLDPKEQDFNLILQVAKVVKEVLDEIGVVGYPKTSGSRGLHVFIPLGAQYNYDQARDFTLLILQIVNRRIPLLTSLERVPARRKSPVYLDYLQNRKGQTLASVYCLRPRIGAPVSTPVMWEELKEGFEPSLFNIHSIFARIDEVGDLFKPVLTEKLHMEAALQKIQWIISV